MDGSFTIDVSSDDKITTDKDQSAFRRAVDNFLSEYLTPDLRQVGRETTGLKSSRAACRRWRKILLKQGWLAPSWPKRYGGAEWSTEQRLYFEQACAEQDAPVIMCSGIRTIGPLIIEAGTDAQKQKYLSAILTGDHEWCQGFSEPQAGSDLAALALRAECDGDEFVLNGSKIWTSFAQYSTHMFLLARCEPGSRRSRGLVFLLVDLNTPGVTVRPIRFIDGESETNQVFFKDVRIPQSDRIGEIGAGWAVAKQLMAIARSNNTTTGALYRALRMARRGAFAAGEMNHVLSAKFADLEMQIDCFKALEARTARDLPMLNCSTPSSVLKLLSTELHQRITEIGLEADPFGALATKKYFATRAATIYSGTSEIHRNILAKDITS